MARPLQGRPSVGSGMQRFHSAAHVAQSAQGQAQVVLNKSDVVVHRPMQTLRIKEGRERKEYTWNGQGNRHRTKREKVLERSCTEYEGM